MATITVCDVCNSHSGCDVRRVTLTVHDTDKRELDMCQPCRERLFKEIREKTKPVPVQQLKTDIDVEVLRCLAEEHAKRREKEPPRNIPAIPISIYPPCPYPHPFPPVEPWKPPIFCKDSTAAPIPEGPLWQ